MLFAEIEYMQKRVTIISFLYYFIFYSSLNYLADFTV